jgi:maltose/maltodextrin transport system substrate-binding protein
MQARPYRTAKRRASLRRAIVSKRLSVIAKALLFLSSLCLLTAHLFAWSSGQLLIWMDSDRANGLRLLAKKFEADWGVKVTIETPENLTNNFLLAVQASKGPDIVIWAHDKVAEWANAGIISPIHIVPEFARKFYPKVWQGVSYKNAIWGYPIALETVTLIYNKKLLPGPPPADLAKLESLNRVIKTKHPGVRTILWDYKSAYYSWGILASAGGYVFQKRGTDYDLNDTGVATPGAIEALSRIVALVRAGILPVGPPQGKGEELLAEGKLAMTISGPWAWPNLIKRGIDFGVAPIPGIDGKPGRPFVGVSVAYLNRLSPNGDLSKQFLEHYLLTDEGLLAMNHLKPIGIPALTSTYLTLARDDIHLRQLKAAADHGEVMPNIPKMGRFFSAVGTALEIATNGQTSAQEALREAAAHLRSQ